MSPSVQGVQSRFTVHAPPPPFAEKTGKTTTICGLPAKRFEPSAQTKQLWKPLEETGSGDGHVIGAMKMAPKDLQALAANPKKLTEFIYKASEMDHYLPLGQAQAEGLLEITPLKSKDVFSAIMSELNPDGEFNDDKETMKTLSDGIRALLPALLGNPPMTNIYKVDRSDGGYGGTEGLVAFNAKTGDVRYIDISWAP
jgi:hypothetical protein